MTINFKLLLVNLSLLNCVVVLLAGCGSSAEKEKLSEEDIKAVIEPVEVELRWYDHTYKIYYDVRGPVRSLKILPLEYLQVENSVNATGWKYEFNQAGHAGSKLNLRNDSHVRINYEYAGRHALKSISALQSGKVSRKTTLETLPDRRIMVTTQDFKNNKETHVLVSRQKVLNGYFEIEKPVEDVELPTYQQFGLQEALIWSNRGGINNGLGNRFYINTGDNVVSSDVYHSGTEQMQGVGGYKYYYDSRGRLTKVESYSLPKFGLYHTTHYIYNDIGLLVSERKVVSANNPFNQAMNESVEYRYLNVDTHGNWLRRHVVHRRGEVTGEFTEQRVIEYY